MDKYQENAMLRTDLRYVTDQLDRVVTQLKDYEGQVDWYEVENAKITVDKVNQFYGFNK